MEDSAMAKAKKLKSGNWRCQVYSHTEIVLQKRKAELMATNFLLEKETKNVLKI